MFDRRPLPSEQSEILCLPLEESDIFCLLLVVSDKRIELYVREALDSRVWFVEKQQTPPPPAVPALHHLTEVLPELPAGETVYEEIDC